MFPFGLTNFAGGAQSWIWEQAATDKGQRLTGVAAKREER